VNPRPLFLANRPQTTRLTLDVADKYSGKIFDTVSKGDAETIGAAIEAAHQAEPAMRGLASYQRQGVLEHLVQRCRERREELAESLCREAGKPIRDSRGEVTRLIDTLKIAAEEATRIYGEVLPLDIAQRSANYLGQWTRVPIGAVGLITPFNFPLNLVAHKIGPAIAAGCPFVLKPASATPLGALILGEILAETDLPEGAFSIIPCAAGDAGGLVDDDRLKLLSFTGSAEVGWSLKARAHRKHVSLELGGNAAVIVDAGSDLDDVVERIVFGAFYQSGQSCISVQRIYAHESLYDNLRRQLVAKTESLVAGDPRDEQTFIGPMIAVEEAERLEQWIAKACERGANVLCGGTRDESLFKPTVVENVPADAELACEEAFGPVVVLTSFSSFDAVLEQVNQSRFGLQAGVFTRDLYRAQRAFEELEVGGVVIGDVPSWRIDHMPYGGVKDSGTGREGLRFAIEEMTERKLLVIRTPDSAG
jgi:acyl-CoA reductase-like NAD-dependent aldehyde dehydrogenase